MSVKTGGMKMYKSVWNLITKYTDDSHAVSIILPVMIVEWTLFNR